MIMLEQKRSGKRKVPKKKEGIKLIYKAEEYWKNFVHLKKCHECGEVAEHYYRFKFYCEDCYQKLKKQREIK